MCLRVLLLGLNQEEREKDQVERKGYTFVFLLLTGVFADEHRMEVCDRLFNGCLALNKTQLVAACIVNVDRRAQV